MKSRVLPALLCILFSPFPGSAQTDPPQRFSVDLDLVGHGILAPGAPSPSLGLGGSAFAEWRPALFLSFGMGLGFTQQFDAPSSALASWDLGGRLYPLGSTRAGEWYLQGTAGLALAKGAVEGGMPGNFHGAVMVGYRSFVDGRNALDLGVQYELLSPFHHPFQGAGIKVGWSFLFGPSPAAGSRSDPDVQDGTDKKPAKEAIKSPDGERMLE